MPRLSVGFGPGLHKMAGRVGQGSPGGFPLNHFPQGVPPREKRHALVNVCTILFDQASFFFITRRTKTGT